MILIFSVKCRRVSNYLTYFVYVTFIVSFATCQKCARHGHIILAINEKIYDIL